MFFFYLSAGLLAKQDSAARAIQGSFRQLHLLSGPRSKWFPSPIYFRSILFSALVFDDLVLLNRTNLAAFINRWAALQGRREQPAVCYNCYFSSCHLCQVSQLQWGISLVWGFKDHCPSTYLTS